MICLFFLFGAEDLVRGTYKKRKVFLQEKPPAVARASTPELAAGYIAMLKQKVDRLQSPDDTKTGFSVVGAKFFDTGTMGMLLVYYPVGIQRTRALKVFIRGRKTMDEVRSSDLQDFADILSNKGEIFAKALEVKRMAAIPAAGASKNRGTPEAVGVPQNTSTTGGGVPVGGPTVASEEPFMRELQERKARAKEQIAEKDRNIRSVRLSFSNWQQVQKLLTWIIKDLGDSDEVKDLEIAAELLNIIDQQSYAKTKPSFASILGMVNEKLRQKGYNDLQESEFLAASSASPQRPRSSMGRASHSPA